MAKLIVILGFMLSFAAGLVISSRSSAVRELIDRASPVDQPGNPTTAPTSRPSRGDFWSRELNLTADQRKQLDSIWSPLASKGRSENENRRREYRRERDAAIADLVPLSRMAEYDRIIDGYSERVSALERESREAYAGAVEQTKQILTAQQRATYEDLLKRHGWGASGSSRGDRHGNNDNNERRSETRATSAPTTQDSTVSPSLSHEPLKGAQ